MSPGEIVKIGCLPLGPNFLPHVFDRAKHHLSAFKEFTSGKLLESFIVAAAIVIAESGKGPQEFLQELEALTRNSGLTCSNMCDKEETDDSESDLEKPNGKHTQKAMNKQKAMKKQKAILQQPIRHQPKNTVKHNQKASQKKPNGKKVDKVPKVEQKAGTKTKQKVSAKQKFNQKKSDGKQKSSQKKASTKNQTSA